MATCSYVGVTNLLNYDVQPSIVYFHLASYVVLFILLFAHFPFLLQTSE